MNVYVDTGAWVAYFDRSDRFHPLVTPYLQATLRQAVDRLVTSDYVLDETVSYLRYHVSHATALTAFQALSALAQAQRLTMLEVNRDTRKRAGQIFEQFHEHTFSFTDCTSFALCEVHHIQYAVRVDKDFVIFGLIILPEELARSVLLPPHH
jgi:predicted nucleic acid-binding protein